MSITPPYLQPGHKVAVVATAKKIAVEDVQRGTDHLRSWGLQHQFGDNLFSESHQFAGTDTQRIADMQAALDDDSVNAILCARGGYGTVRLIDSLDFSRFRENPKWLIGYSDITVLHSHIHRHFNIETLHATMPINFLELQAPNTATESMRKALFGKELGYEIAAGESCTTRAISIENVHGTRIGCTTDVFTLYTNNKI